MADGTNVVEPTSPTATQITTVDSKEIDFGGGDVRDRQRMMLAGSGATDDVATAATTPTGTERGLVTRDPATGTDGASPPAIPGTGIRGWLRAIYDRLTDGSQRASIGTPGGLAWVNTAGVATPLIPTVSGAGRLRVTEEPESLFYDPFDSALNTSDQWNAPVTTSGATVTQGTGGETFASGTTAGAIARLQSIPTFVGQVPGYMEIGYALQFLASPPTNVARFWGVGTPPVGGATATAPIFDGIGWLLDIDAKLYAVVYSAGALVFSKDLSAIQPTDGLYRRYNIQARTDRIFWYIGSQDVPVADVSFKFPQTQKLPLLIQLVNHTAAPATSSVIVCTGVAVGDTGRSATQIADGTYGFRKASVDKQNALLTQTGGLVTAQTTRVSVGTVASQIDGGALATRKSVEIKYNAGGAANNGFVYVGFAAGLTTAQGRELSPGESVVLDVTSAVPIYAVSSNAAQAVQVTELG